MRTAFVAFLILILVGAGTYYWLKQDRGGPMPNIQVSEPTNFAQPGILHFPSVESGQSQGTFEFSENGATTTLKILMDELSVCGAQNGAIMCMAMSITFDKPFNEKRAMMEGIRSGDEILVRKMRVLQEGEMAMPLEPGNVFISWPHAIELFKACRVEMATQTHALDVYLDLKDGRTVRAVEPMIDDMFKIIQATQGQCGTFPVGTE